MTKYCVYLTREQIANLNAQTIKTGVTASEQIRRAIDAAHDPCELCARTTQPLTAHHLVPKARHNKKVKRDLGKDRNKTAMICRPCHSEIHDLFTEKELEREYNTIALLKAHPDVIVWIEWVSKRPNWRG